MPEHQDAGEALDAAAGKGEPTARYVEKRFGSVRTYSLHPDKLVFESRGFLLPASATISFPLEQMSPNYARIELANPRFRNGIKLLVLAVPMTIWLAVMGWGFVLDTTAGSLRLFPVFLIGLLALMSLAGLLSVVICPRRLEYYRFSSTAGGPGFDVGRIGPNRGEFDDFVAQLVGAIERVRSGAQGARDAP